MGNAAKPILDDGAFQAFEEGGKVSFPPDLRAELAEAFSACCESFLLAEEFFSPEAQAAAKSVCRRLSFSRSSIAAAEEMLETPAILHAFMHAVGTVMATTEHIRSELPRALSILKALVEQAERVEKEIDLRSGKQDPQGQSASAPAAPAIRTLICSAGE